MAHGEVGACRGGVTFGLHHVSGPVVSALKLSN